MIHFEQPHRSPYPGIGNENDLVYRPNLRAGIMNGFVKELKCPVCGEMFHIYSLKHAWYIGRNATGHRNYVCSYHCMRKRELEGKKVETHEKGSHRWQTSLKAAIARREKCQKNLKYWESIKNDQRAYTNAYRWRNELREVEEYLKRKGVIK